MMGNESCHFYPLQSRPPSKSRVKYFFRISNIFLIFDKMNPKYIIAGNRVTGRCYLRMGRVVNHKNLVVGYEHVWGGGWLERNDNEKTITLYGSSCDFGSADFGHLRLIRN